MSIEQENFDNIQKNETELDQYGVWVKKTPEKTDEAGEDFFLMTWILQMKVQFHRKR